MPLCFINRNLWQILAIRADQIAGSIIKYYESTAIRKFIFRRLQCQEEIKSDKKKPKAQIERKRKNRFLGTSFQIKLHAPI